MNRSFSKIRHIQEANQKLEKRLINEDDDNLFLKRRLSTIEELIDEVKRRMLVQEMRDENK